MTHPIFGHFVSERFGSRIVGKLGQIERKTQDSGLTAVGGVRGARSGRDLSVRAGRARVRSNGRFVRAQGAHHTTVTVAVLTRRAVWETTRRETTLVNTENEEPSSQQRWLVPNNPERATCSQRPLETTPANLE